MFPGNGDFCACRRGSRNSALIRVNVKEPWFFITGAVHLMKGGGDQRQESATIGDPKKKMDKLLGWQLD